MKLPTKHTNQQRADKWETNWQRLIACGRVLSDAEWRQEARELDREAATRRKCSLFTPDVPTKC